MRAPLNQQSDAQLQSNTTQVIEFHKRSFPELVIFPSQPIETYTPRGQSTRYRSEVISLPHIFNVLLGKKHFMVPLLSKRNKSTC